MTQTTISLGEKKMGFGQPAFMIAELSGNHHQKYEEADALVHAAAKAGADAIKLQTYTPDTITLNSDREWFRVGGGKDMPSGWTGQTLHSLFEGAHTPWDWQPRLKELTESLGMIFFSSPFDNTAVDFLESMGVLLYKIASYEVVHIPLIKKIAQAGKPVVMSIGFASPKEVDLAIKTLHENGAQDIVILHCVTSYSDKPEFTHMNLTTIADIEKRFSVPGGFSDNNGGIVAPVVAVVAGGATVVEKHFILDRTLEGPDARFSLEPDEFAEMVRLIRRGEAGEHEAVLAEVASEGEIDSLMGHVQYGPANEQEAHYILSRPSIWAKANIKKGEVFTTNNIRVARPGAGLMPKEYEAVLGKHAAEDINFATPLTQHMIA
jgi:pseudaminic acid synthase